MVDKVLFSSTTDEWETPQDFFDRLNDEFHFGLDAAATQFNRKCLHYIPEKSDALTVPWNEITDQPIWLNPPYSKIAAFLKKAYDESQLGSAVVCLIPSRTDTKYWHAHVMQAAEIRFVKGRLRFGMSKNSAPFPSCVVVFQPKRPDFYRPVCSTMKVTA